MGEHRAFKEAGLWLEIRTRHGTWLTVLTALVLALVLVGHAAVPITLT